MRVGFLDFGTSALNLFILLDPFLHETIKIGPTVSNQYCYCPDSRFEPELKNEDSHNCLSTGPDFAKKSDVQKSVQKILQYDRGP